MILYSVKQPAMIQPSSQVSQSFDSYDLYNFVAWLRHNIKNSQQKRLKPESIFTYEGGGTNPCDAGLDLSGSWQQGHSATYNAPSRI